MGCFSFLSELFGFSVVSKNARTRPGLTYGLVALFWFWAFAEGAMIVRYAHLGEHPYVFQLMPMASCASPAVAAVGVVLFTLGDALTNLFSTALTHSFGIEPPIDLYKLTGNSAPLLTWGAYVRLNLIGLMCYALLPGILGRLFSQIVRSMTSRLFASRRRPAAADGPKDDEILVNEGPNGDGNPDTIEAAPSEATGEILINEGPDGGGILDTPRGTVREGALEHTGGLERVPRDTPGLSSVPERIEGQLERVPLDSPGEILINEGPDGDGILDTPSQTLRGEPLEFASGASGPRESPGTGQWSESIREDVVRGPRESFGGERIRENTAGGPRESFGGERIRENTAGGPRESFGGERIRENTAGGPRESFGGERIRENTAGGPRESFGGERIRENTAALSGASEGMTGIGNLGEVRDSLPGIGFLGGSRHSLPGIGFLGTAQAATRGLRPLVPRTRKPPRIPPHVLREARARAAQAAHAARGGAGPRRGRPPRGPGRGGFDSLPPHLSGPGGPGHRPSWTDAIPPYIGAVLGAAGGTILGGGVYYGGMYTEYHTIRTITMGSPDASCFKMDADYAVQNVVAGGTMAPAGGAAVVATTGGASGNAGGTAGVSGAAGVTGATGGFAGATAGASGQAGVGGASRPPTGGDDDDNPWDFADKFVDSVKNSGESNNTRRSADLTSDAGDRLGFDPTDPDAVQDFRNRQQQAADAHGDALSGEAGAGNRFNDAIDAENVALNDYTNAQTQVADCQNRIDTLNGEIDTIRSQIDGADPATAQGLRDRLNTAQSELDGWRSQQSRAEYVADEAGRRWSDAADGRARAGQDFADAQAAMGRARADMDGLRGQDGTLSQHNRGQQDLDASNRRLGQLSLIANIMLDANKYNNDGMSGVEALTAGTGANLAANAATESFGTADFAAGIFFPTSMQGLVPSNAVKDAVQTSMEAYTSFWQWMGGDETAFDRFGQRAADGKTGWIAQGYAELAQTAGTMWEAPADTLRDFAQGVQDIWNAGPLELAGEAIDRFAQDALNGKEGPIAQTVADLANASGHLYENPGQTVREFGEDASTILQHGNPSDLLLGQEGSDRAVAILGPIGEGYKGMAELAGEAWEEPGQFASDVKDVAVMTVKDGASYIADTGRSAAGWIRSWF